MQCRPARCSNQPDLDPAGSMRNEIGFTSPNAARWRNRRATRGRRSFSSGCERKWRRYALRSPSSDELAAMRSSGPRFTLGAADPHLLASLWWTRRDLQRRSRKHAGDAQCGRAAPRFSLRTTGHSWSHHGPILDPNLELVVLALRAAKAKLSHVIVTTAQRNLWKRPTLRWFAAMVTLRDGASRRAHAYWCIDHQIFRP